MVRAYHVIFSTYGHWLPNDPRGSWSDYVRVWDLWQQGDATKTGERRNTTFDPHDHEARIDAKEFLRHPPVLFSGRQALSVAKGFRNSVERSGFIVFACAILPDHVHLVLRRTRYNVEYAAGQFKGEATKQLLRDGLHPFKEMATPPSPWTRKGWNVFLNDEVEVVSAIRYVEANPEKENKPRQRWSFVRRFEG